MLTRREFLQAQMMGITLIVVEPLHLLRPAKPAVPRAACPGRTMCALQAILSGWTASTRS